MKNRRLYILGMFLSFALFIGAAFLPESLGDMRMLIAFIAMAGSIVFPIALIVSVIKSRKKPTSAQETPSPSSIPVQTTLTPVQPVQTAPPAQPKPPAKKAEKIERVHVRGVNNNTKNIIAVATENPDYSLSKRELQEDFLDERVWQYQFFVDAKLVPEPENEYDPNAIMVQADGLCIGHVPAGSTAHIRKLMESGRIKYMDLQIGGGKYKEVTEDDDGEYELDRGEKPYSAILELHLTDEIQEATP